MFADDGRIVSSTDDIAVPVDLDRIVGKNTFELIVHAQQCKVHFCRRLLFSLTERETNELCSCC